MRRQWVFIAMAAAILLGLPGQALADAVLTRKLDGLYREIGVDEARTPPVDNADIERVGHKALRQTGDKRLYGLWRTAYAYKNNGLLADLNRWTTIIRGVGARERDDSLTALADLMDRAYRRETSSAAGFTPTDWNRFLTASGPDIALMAGVERVRALGDDGRWAEAQREAAGLLVATERRGAIARPVLAEVHQVLSYTLADSGEKEGALEHMAKAARLDEPDSFYMRKIERLYDIAFTAAEVGELDAAQRFATVHSRMSRATGDPDLITWDRYLCALIARNLAAPTRLLACLKGGEARLARPESRAMAQLLRMRAQARAELGDAAGARADLAAVRGLAADVLEPDPQSDLLTQAYIDLAEGRGAEAFRKLDRWRVADAKAAKAAQERTAAQVALALKNELRSKRDESRRLAAEVALNRRLAQGWVLITLLLGALVIGGVAWAFYLRRVSTRLREARSRAEAASEAKSAFLAVMSHEVRTPLNGMLGLAQALRADSEEGRGREQIDLLIDSGETLLFLLNDILDLSKIEAGKLEIAPTAGDLAQTCSRLVGGYQPIARDKGIALEFRIEGVQPEPLLFDAVRVRQCLTNLVSNALKFTNSGRVEVCLSCGPDLASGRQRVRLRVSDTGIGMSPETQAKLFRAFTQADASTTRTFGGTGLGLNITRRLVELMGGRIDVRSQEGKGSVFSIEMLVDAVGETEASAEAASPRQPADLALAALPGCRVLVVDDHPVNRRVIRLFLTPFDCDLVEVENGLEALEALEREPIDIVLMDVNMPVMDGLEATRRLRADPRFARLPVIALTADVMSAQIKTCLEAGADAHVAKPIDLRILLSVMDQALAARAAGARGADVLSAGT